MDEDFKQYVYAPIEKVLTGNEDYKKLMRESETHKSNADLYDELLDQMAAMEQELCYIQGFNNVMSLSRMQ